MHWLFQLFLLQDLVKIFLEDNLTLSLPEQFRQSVLRELFQKAQQGWDIDHFLMSSDDEEQFSLLMFLVESM